MNDDLEKCKIFTQNNLWHGAINFYLAHDFGGAGDITTQHKYQSLQTYSEKEEIPVVMPKTINKKNEFHLEL